MEKQEVSPHKWAKEIIAWAHGAEIECRLRDSDVWILQSNPGWFENNEYRIYDPLREIKEAFERGETIQGRMDNFSKWNNYNKSIGTLSVESIKDSNGWEWRVKPDIKLEVGKDYIHVFGNWLVIDRVGICGNLGFAYNGESFDSQLICSDPKYWREATKEEVKQFFERHLIKRYGEDWKNVKIKECMYFVESDLINTSVHDCYIKKSHLVTIDGWIAWNKNGCLYNNGKWAEVLEEENQYVPFEEKDKEQFRGKWIKRKDGDIEMKITSFGTLSANTFLIEGCSPKHLLEDFTFIDGAPFGKVK